MPYCLQFTACYCVKQKYEIFAYATKNMLDETNLPKDLQLQSAWFGESDAYLRFADTDDATALLIERETTITKSLIQDLLERKLFEKNGTRVQLGDQTLHTAQSAKSMRSAGTNVYPYYIDAIVTPEISSQNGCNVTYMPKYIEYRCPVASIDTMFNRVFANSPEFSFHLSIFSVKFYLL